MRKLIDGLIAFALFLIFVVMMLIVFNILASRHG